MEEWIFDDMHGFDKIYQIDWIDKIDQIDKNEIKYGFRNYISCIRPYQTFGLGKIHPV